MEKDVEINNNNIQYAKQMKKKNIKEAFLWIIGVIIFCIIIIIIAFYTKLNIMGYVVPGVIFFGGIIILALINGIIEWTDEIDNRIQIKEMIDTGSNYDMEIIDANIIKIGWICKNEYYSVLLHNYDDLPIMFNTFDGERIYGVQINDDLSAVITR